MVYFDARSEYSNQLCQCIVPAIFKMFMDLLKKAREDVGTDSRRMLYQYQVLLNEIPDWNMDKVYREINRLKDVIQCEYLEELITAVFLAHTKVLMAIRMSSADLNVNLSVPKVDHFLFKVLCETAKLFWKSTYLFRDDIGNLDKQQNLRHAENLVGDGVTTAVRAMIPVKNILRDCIKIGATGIEQSVRKDADDSDSDDDEVSATAAALPAIAEPSPPVDDQVETPGDVSVESEMVADSATASTAAAADAVASGNDIIVNDREETVSLASMEDINDSATVVEDHHILQINEEDDQGVTFAEYDSVFDGNESNMKFDPKTGEIIDGELIIDDSPGELLNEFDELTDDSPRSIGLTLSEDLEMDGYETLVG